MFSNYCNMEISTLPTTLRTSVANFAVYPRICPGLFCGLPSFFEDLPVACFCWKLFTFGLVFRRFCYANCTFCELYGAFAFHCKRNLGVSLRKFANFGLVLRICLPCFVFNFLLAFCFVSWQTPFGLVFWLNCLFSSCFCKITWHHCCALYAVTESILRQRGGFYCHENEIYKQA